MRHAVAVLMVALLAGCGYWSVQERETSFEKTSRAYARTLEWSNFEGLAAFVKVPEGGAPFDPGVYQDYKVTSYKPKAGLGSAASGAVQRTAQISYLWLPRMSERSTTVQEVWEYAEKDKRWLLKSGLPRFR
jgi:hypothetical protein